MIDPGITAFFNETYDSTCKMVLIYLTKRCKNMSDINDICQEVYMEFFHILVDKGIEYVDNPEGLLIRLSKRKIHKYYSLRDRMEEVFAFGKNEDGEEYPYEEQLSDTEFDRYIYTKDEEILIEEIHIFLKKKPVDVQKIFYLHFELEQTISQIAKIMSMKESTVKNKLYRTRDELRKLYQKEEITDENRTGIAESRSLERNA